MNRESDLAFLEFSVAQKEHFSPAHWEALDRPKVQKATIALFLANMPWFGHQDELFKIAHRFQPGCVGRFSALAQKTSFSPSRFRGLLQSALRHETLSRSG